MKHVKKYSKFVVEQDMMAAGMTAGAAPQKKEKRYSFLFIDPGDDDAHRKYPDGSSSVDYSVYSVTEVELEEWAKKNIVSTEKNKLTDDLAKLRRTNLINIVKGDKVNISNEDIPFINSLKHAVSTDMFGKREPDTTIIFTGEGKPTTEDINITFIRHHSNKKV